MRKTIFEVLDFDTEVSVMINSAGNIDIDLSSNDGESTLEATLTREEAEQLIEALQKAIRG